MNVAVLGTLAKKRGDMAPTSGVELTCFATPSLTPDAFCEVSVTYDGNGADAPVNCVSGGTATGSSTYGSYTASKAVDGSTSTYFRSGGGNTAWWKYDFGEGVTKIIRYIYAYRVRNEGYAVRCMVQGSNNDSDWTDIYYVVFSTTSGWQTVQFPNSVGYRYYRFYFTFTRGLSVYVYEVQMAEACSTVLIWEALGSYNILGNDAFNFGKSGYVFDSWNTQADGGGTEYAPDDPISLTGPITLYAQWTEEY